MRSLDPKRVHIRAVRGHAVFAGQHALRCEMIAYAAAEPYSGKLPGDDQHYAWDSKRADKQGLGKKFGGLTATFGEGKVKLRAFCFLVILLSGLAGSASESKITRKQDRKSTRLNSSHQIISYAV